MVSIDTVYQTVLALANKEQRGYITPLEFNLYANQAQMDIFEQYFYDLNQFLRLPGNDTIHSDVVDMLEEKISIFEKNDLIYLDENFNVYNIKYTIENGADDFYRIANIYYDRQGTLTVIDQVSSKEIVDLLRSPLMKPSSSYRPACVIKNGILTLYPKSLKPTYITVDYIRKPNKVEWNYTTINDKPIYNSESSVDFDLHASDKQDLVIKILGLAGITLKDASLYQISVSEDNKNIQQEKQ